MTVPSILVAEDDPVFSRVIAFTLTQRGFAVETAGDGEQALHKLECSEYQLLVSDHQMPRMSGLDLIARLRNQAKFADLPIILCTAKGLELDTEALRVEHRLAHIMHKPFSPRTLAEIVRDILSKLGAECVNGV